LRQRKLYAALAVLAVTLLVQGVPTAYAATASPTPTPTSTPTPTPTATPTTQPPPPPVVPPTPDPQLAAARRALLQQIRQTLNGNVADALGVQFQLAQSLSDNSRQQVELGARVADAQTQIQALDDQIAALDAQIVSTQERIDQDRAQAAAIARSVYYTPDSFLLSIFAAGSLQELMTSASDRLVAGARAELIERQLADDLQRLNDEQAAATAARLAKSKALESLNARLVTLVDLAASQQELGQRVADQLAQVNAELSQVANQDPALAQQILAQLEGQQGAILAAAGQEIWTQVRLWQQTTGAIPAPPVSGRHSRAHPLVWPEPGAVISQGFGPTSLTIEPPYGQYAHFHTGIDLAAPELTAVLAADDGTVALVGGSDYGYGNYVVIAHRAGLVTLYGHLNKALVKAGDTVTQGQLIGLEGSTGHSTGPHLHFELRLNNEPIDPAPYLPPGAPSSIGLNGD
jgi:murein DD-endopeptidase MepM/ murein hydrolase activator NlpD